MDGSVGGVSNSWFLLGLDLGPGIEPRVWALLSGSLLILLPLLLYLLTCTCIFSLFSLK